jgi:alkanesulfonate monooxygenase SsuD/methylene tetrahydromethanopterin reductase-like flavin-dependent oxidoreductase (luciferase family)
VAERAIEFGLFVNPSAESYRDSLEMVRAAEQGGIDLIGIQDHPYQHRFLDTWLLIADLLARTERLRFFPDVANLPLRLPTLMAKQAASLDWMSGGRFELGLGAGAFWEGIAAMGGRALSPGQSVDALEEAIQILRACWSGERTVDFEGRYYRVKGFHPGPPPPHPIEIWIGAYRPRMLRLTGRLADGWLPSQGYMPPEQVAETRKAIDEAAAKAGRDPSEIRGLYNVGGIEGDADAWAETLDGWADELSVTTFILPAENVAQVEWLISEVIPTLKH